MSKARDHLVSARHDERGSALVATLSVIVILGVMVAISLSLNIGSSPTPKVTSPTNVTTTTAPKTVASGASEATVAACEANYAIVSNAVQTYRALNGSSPPAGTSWATSSANGGPIMQSWPSAPSSYAIVWNGRELSVAPTKGAPTHGTEGSQALKTGCYAL
jgi:hypothetical protein